MSELPVRSAPSPSLLARLIDSPQLERAVRELPSERFAALIRQVGLEDAGELVALATTEQLVATFDEDLFVNPRPGEREVFDARRFATWLEVLLEAGDDVAARRVAQLSEDFVVHALSSLVLVFDQEQLREAITSDDDAGEEADKALESALSEELDGYLLVARREEGWDALLALVLALDRSHRALLERVLDRCVDFASDYVDDLEALSEVLSGADSLAEDVEAEREERRARQGFVEARAAKGFLALAQRPLGDDLGAVPRDATTRAYFRDLAASAGAPALSPQRQAREAGAGLLERALGSHPALGAPSSDPGHDGDEQRLTLALHALGDDAPARYEERLGELAYLANVVLAGLPGARGERLRPVDAARAALVTVALGAELLAREVTPGRRGEPRTASPEALRAVLDAHPADLLFRKAVSTLVARGLAADTGGVLRSRAELARVLAQLDAPALPRG